MPRVRLDTLLVSRGLAPSRERARALVLAGHVRVGDRPATKAGQLVADGAAISLIAPDHPWVSRGGIKLAHALGTFGVPVAGRLALDIGASTGGFTLDVGRGQLDWSLRTDPRVIVLERVNARALAPDQLPPACRLVDLVTIDVSFISLRLILPVVPRLLAPGGDVIALVKPQFEAGRDEVGRRGLVHDPEVHARVVAEVVAAADRIGLARVAQTDSPIPGATGNREYFLLLRAAGVPD